MARHQVFLAGLIVCSSVAAQELSDAAKVEFFSQKIFPILKENCFKCHGEKEKLKGEFRITSRAGLLKGGDIGPAINLKAPEQSLLLAMLSYKDEDHEMPPKAKLPIAQIKLLTRWVKLGAPYNPAQEIAGTAGHVLPNTQINVRTRAYWAFQPLKRPNPPLAANADWNGNAIDALIFDRLGKNKLTPNGPADKSQLIRRAYYDLTGLPPTPREVEAFVKDNSPKAFEKVIDHLLAKPQYGEKWGRHWLDLVRYAETNGYERDGPKPHVWRYRDYVIRAFNEDKPYDRFIMEQLAGDELEPFRADAFTATGFYRLGLWDDEPADRELAFFEGMDDLVRTTSETFLGLSLGCARCHDHKIDPLPTADYYSFLAFFRNIRHYGVRGHNTVMDASVRPLLPAVKRDTYRKDTEDRKRRLAEAERELRRTDDLARKQLKAGELDDYNFEANRIPILKKYLGQWVKPEAFKKYETAFAERKRLRATSGKNAEMALVVTEHKNAPPPTHILKRGTPSLKGDVVEPAFPQILDFPKPKLPKKAAGDLSSGRRTVLAQWIASGKNPLTAKVMANRLWQHHFGRGIVRSANNFGYIGDAPTHPLLLDWLASELVDGGWKLKRMHKLIMMSRTYQMSSAGNATALAADPNNDFFWRFNMRRLTAEEIRDSILALTGQLNLKMGGPHIYTELPPEVLHTASRPGSAWGKSPPAERHRRSIYIHVKRSLHEPFLAAFDWADTDNTCDVRFVTTVPTQTLTMLNSKFLNDSAEVLALRLQEEHPNDPKAQVTRALTLATSRPATAEDIADGLKLIEHFTKKGIKHPQALQRFCLLVLNLNEFVYLD